MNQIEFEELNEGNRGVKEKDNKMTKEGMNAIDIMIVCEMFK